jgi:ATP-dependent Clp protease, protease subunit
MLQSQELSRTIVISTGIDEVVAGQVIDHIMAINEYDESRSQIVVGGQPYMPEPIEIFINSGGGSVSDGFAIIDAMEMSDTPIITYGMGTVASMALAIFVAGDHRVASRHTRFMYHGVAYGMMGDMPAHKARMEEVELMQRMYNSLMRERTDFPQEQMDKICADSGKDYYFSAKEAKKLGVAHEVTKKPKKKYQFMTEDELTKAMEEIQELAESLPQARDEAKKTK